jgi:glycosyltransferase involved in cell wall biosynthesis
MKIFSVHYNKPEYISHQYNSFLKFFDDNFEYYVIDNSPDSSVSKKIQDECAKVNCSYIKIENNYYTQSPSYSHAYSLNCSLRYINEFDDVMFIDHDMFLVKSFKTNYDYDLMFANQKRGHINYPWPGVLVFNKIKNIKDIDFLPQNIEGVECDTGGKLFYYIKNGNFTFSHFTHNYVFENLETELINGCFLHVCKGSNWDNSNVLDKKFKLINEMYGINLGD